MSAVDSLHLRRQRPPTVSFVAWWWFMLAGALAATLIAGAFTAWPATVTPDDGVVRVRT